MKNFSLIEKAYPNGLDKYPEASLFVRNKVVQLLFEGITTEFSKLIHKIDEKYPESKAIIKVRVIYKLF